MRSLIVIPAYNEEENIGKVIDRVKQYDIDYLVVNDCSTDSTGAILDEKGIEHLDLPINLGIAGVTRLGFNYAHDNDYDCVVCIDGDGQHLPEYVKDLMKEIENGCDYVVGSRFLTEKKPWSMRSLALRVRMRRRILE